jgi:guanosine-3',5'-bis(diphosphate) 3'-pyrophosphohydrolase
LGEETSIRPIRPSLAFERALRLAASGHRDQVRKGSEVPYVEHPMAVALILDRAGCDEEVVIAGLLHDLVEDTDVTLDEIRREFGDRVAAIVAACSEEKLDPQGRKRPWVDRKMDHLQAVGRSDGDVHAVVLADKLHNLLSIELDLTEGRPVWDTFNAGRDQVLWYYGAMLDACRSDDPRLLGLLGDCRRLLSQVAAFGP